MKQIVTRGVFNVLSNYRTYLPAVAILFSSLLVLSACSKGSATATPAAASRSAPRPVAISRGTLVVNVSSNGTFTSLTSSKLAFGASGKITEVNVKTGDKVTKGKVLARIDDTQLKQAVTQAELSLKIVQSKLDTMLAGSKKEEIDIARLNLTVAQANLDKVKAGPTSSDMASAQAAVVSAYATLKIAQSNLADLKASPKPSDILQSQATYDSATASLATAQSNLATVMAGPTRVELLAAQHSLEQAHTATIQADIAAQVPSAQDPLGRLRSAQIAAHTSESAAQARLDELLTRPTPIELAATHAQFDQVTANRAIAKAKLDLILAGPTASEIIAADNAVANAKASIGTVQSKLDDLKKSPLVQDIASAQVVVLNAQLQLQAKLTPYTTDDLLQSRSSVEQAKLSLDNAVTALVNAPIIAPFDGVVASVVANLGESSSGASVQVVNPSLLRLDITVDELDVAKVKPGQQAVITMDSQAGKVFRGTVQAVSPQGATTQGVTSYQATLAVTLPEGITLLVGSSATARIVVDSKQDVLVVPRNALRTVGRTQVVQVVDDKGLTVDRTVKVGLANDLQAEVLEGLQEGEKVMARPVSGGGGGGIIIPAGLIPGQGGAGSGGFGGPPGGAPPAGGFGGGVAPAGGRR
ncbi:MAG: efflux RND transporter periplasmic adaptor subunit [Dehalococcoidia bacterium]|nr:efflux RND transporter periplasmic adaptor subunit [Dehalococcoidia bacterium]